MTEFHASGAGSEDIDPATEAEIREAMSGVEEEAVESGNGDAEANQFETRLAEMQADLQRVQAEYVNYRKRVERDRGVARDSAIADVLTELLPILDDFGRAAEHDELTGAFKSVAESIEAVARRLGLESYGAVGEEFDPAVHEALTHETSDAAGPTVTVVKAVYQTGYRHVSRVLRPARVAVADVPAS